MDNQRGWFLRSLRVAGSDPFKARKLVRHGNRCRLQHSSTTACASLMRKGGRPKNALAGWIHFSSRFAADGKNPKIASFLQET